LSLAATHNQKTVASALDDAFSSASGDLEDVLVVIDLFETEAEVREAFDQLNPKPSNAHVDLSFAGLQHFMWRIEQRLQHRRRLGLHGAAPETTFNKDFATDGFPRLASALDDPALLGRILAGSKASSSEGQSTVKEKKPLSFFTRGFGLLTDKDSTSTRTGYDARTAGLMVGLDCRPDDNWIVGVGLEYSHTEIDWDLSRGKGNIDSIRIAPFASFFKDHWHIDFSASYGRNMYETERMIEFMNRTARSDHHGNEFSFYAGGGYIFDLNPLLVEPLISIGYTYLDEESYNERGADSLNLQVSERDTDRLQSTVGMRLSYKFKKKWGYLVPELTARWSHEFLDDDRDLTSRFENIPDRQLSIRTDDLECDSILMGTGVTMLIGDHVSAYIHYNAALQKDFDAHVAMAGVRIQF